MNAKRGNREQAVFVSLLCRALRATKEVRREWPGGTDKEEAEMTGPTMRGGDVTLGYKSQSEQQCKSSVC